MNNETQLLQSVKGIANKFEIDIRQNGELFNVYSLLNIEHRENETHSVILADLLSPNGTHGQGRLFLNLFVETLEEENLFNENVKVKREHSIGKINDDYTKGGRIDILITDEKNTWIIENKIYAKDQLNQIERYRASDKNATIIYLKPASHEKYKGDSKLVDHDISYEKEISEWLQKIIDNEDLKEKEYLRNSIKQYYNLVQNIAFTGYTQKMNTELRNEIKNNIEAAFNIKENYNSAIDELYENELSEIKNHFKEKGYELIEEEYDLYLTKPNWKEKNLAIGFEFDSKKEFKDLGIGICRENGEEIINEEIIVKIRNIMEANYKSNDHWPLFNYPFGTQSMYDIELAKKLHKGEFQTTIIAELESYAKIIDKLIA